jgi:hypothetical protein
MVAAVGTGPRVTTSSAHAGTPAPVAFAAFASVRQPSSVPPGPSPRAAVPSPGQSYQYQLNDPPTTSDLSTQVAWWDIDAFDTPASTVAAIRAKGEHAICYVDVGGAENWRPDYGTFPPSVLGNPIGGWPKERYVDVRQLAVLSRIEGARFDMCKVKGFDAVDPDVLDAYWKSSGFPLTVEDQLRYNDMLAGLAHARGMAIALKGDPELAAREVSTFDFSIDESCFQWSECGRLAPFLQARKAVFDVEYGIAPATFCPSLRQVGIVGIEKHVDLDAWRLSC